MLEFDLNGHSVKNSIGQSLEIPSQYIRSGKYAQEPETPVKNGYTFRGWKEKESGDYWDFNKNVVTKNLTLVASWLWDSTLQLDYGDLQWKVSQKYELQNLSEIKSIKKHYLEHRIVEMGAQYFPQTDIASAIKKSNCKSSYGGCGPIAMMGVLDYFSRYKEYTRLEKNPENSQDRVQLATDVLCNTPTFEVGWNEKSTLTLPTGYLTGFSKVTEKYVYSNKIVAENSLNLLGLSGKSNLNKLKKSIDAGIPVTMYMGTVYGEGPFKEHFVNVDGYVEIEVEAYGKKYVQTYLRARLNWGNYEASQVFCDADILSVPLTGIITYSFNNESFKIKADDFSSFVNSNNQGQYYFYEKNKKIYLMTGESFMTRRKRCGFIDEQYLVLSPNKKDAGEAYLEFVFDEDISGIDYSICFWGRAEGMYEFMGDYVHIEYWTGESFSLAQNINLEQLSCDKNDMTHLSIRFSKPVKRFRIYAFKKDAIQSWNRGRVVIDDISVYYK